MGLYNLYSIQFPLSQDIQFFSHQERAEEDEGNKVGVGKGAAAFRFFVP